MDRISDQIKRGALIELARIDFWFFLQATYPDFYKDDRPHLKELAEALQRTYEGEGKKRLMINMPPRHGKSFTLINFCQWVLGRKQTNKVISVSYNETLSSRFSKGVRDQIETVNLEVEKIGFQDVFPECKIKHGDASVSMWSLEKQYFNYLGTGMGGTITGIGCNIGIIDDPIKNAEEAFNDRVLENHWKFYTDTFLSRLESDSIQIINMTRWSTNDLCGKILDMEPEKWEVLKMEACDDGVMLCPPLLSKEDYEDKKRKTSPAIFNANYHQEPVDEEGRMYKELKTYDVVPDGERLNYTDTADEGKDYFCSINFVVFEEQIYVTDILFTRKGMEYTEPELAKMLTNGNIHRAIIESNNGGRGFARNVKRIMTEKHNNNFTVVKPFFQKKNKKSRIWNNAYWIEENCFFPKDWGNRWQEFYVSMKKYKREGVNKHDDAQDCLTGCAEQVNKIKRIFK